MKGVALNFSRPGTPTDNAFIESINGKFRAECLNQRWFLEASTTRPENAKLGVETTMRCDHIARSAISRRYRW
jgi:putative transposase